MIHSPAVSQPARNSLGSYAASQRRLMIGFGVAILVVVGVAFALLGGSRSDVGHAIDLAFAPDGALWILAGNGRVSKLRQTDAAP